MNTYKAVIFDLDGTLLDTVQDIADSVNLALASFGWQQYSLNEYRKLVGAGLDELLVSLLSNYAQDETFFQKFRMEVVNHYTQRLTHKTQPYPGIQQLLGELREWGIPRAVLSNKAHDKTEQVVNHFFKAHLLSPVVGAHANLPLKPDPLGAQKIAEKLELRPSQILYLGDTPSDMETATRAGMLPLGVEWGFRPANELIAGGAYDNLTHPNKLWDYLEV
jgi:phosphoglycolate phosphatase